MKVISFWILDTMDEKFNKSFFRPKHEGHNILDQTY